MLGKAAYAAEYDANGNMASRVVDEQAQWPGTVVLMAVTALRVVDRTRQHFSPATKGHRCWSGTRRTGARTRGMQLGTQDNGSSVFLDLNTRVVTFFNDSTGVTHSTYRVVSVQEFFTSLQRYNTVLPPGLTWQQLEQLLMAAGVGQ